MSQERLLINFDKSKENIKRQLVSIIPTRNIHVETGRSRIAAEIETGKRTPYQTPFELEGIKGLIEREEDALIVAASLAKYRYSVNNAFISDIGAGLYTMLTSQSAGLYDCREIFTRDLKTGIEEPVGARIVLSMETLFKAAFGPLVNNTGRAIIGAGEIIRKAKEKILPIINGLEPTPRAYASVQRRNKKGEKVEAFLSGEPLKVYRQLSGAKDALIVDLDYFFFPAIDKGEKGFLANDLFLHQIAGLTSFLQLGARIEGQGKKNCIGVSTARKILLACQAAYELKYFAHGIVKENSSSRVNISLRRSAVKDLYPSAINDEGRIRFGAFSRAVSMAGLYFNNAMVATGIKQELLKQKNVLIPATGKGAEFPENYPQVVYIKADRTK